jgi:hypothetical protein
MIDLLRQAKRYLIPVSYLLFDSWFALPSLLRDVRELNLHTICMVKALPNVRYDYQGKQMNLKKLYASIKKNRGRAKILASVIVSIGKGKNGEPVHAKTVFVRDRNQRRKWLAKEHFGSRWVGVDG